jgi:hypothetical protein
MTKKYQTFACTSILSTLAPSKENAGKLSSTILMSMQGEIQGRYTLDFLLQNFAKLALFDAFQGIDLAA